MTPIMADFTQKYGRLDVDAERVARIMRVAKNAEEHHCKRMEGERHVLDACPICNVFYALDELAAAINEARLDEADWWYGRLKVRRLHQEDDDKRIADLERQQEASK